MAELTYEQELQELLNIEKIANSIERLRNAGYLTKNEFEEKAGKLKTRAKEAAEAAVAKRVA